MFSIEDRNALVEKHFGKIKTIARRIVSNGVPDSEYDDLVQEGVIGLMSALDRFDDTKETSIIQYCEFRIKGSMLDYLRKQDITPRGVREKIRQRDLDIQRYKVEFKQVPTQLEMAEFIEMDIEEYEKKFRDVVGLTFMSIDKIVGKDDGNFSLKLIDILPDESIDLIDAISKKEKYEFIIEKINKLSQRTKQIMMLYFVHELTMKEIGKFFELTESRISQIIDIAADKLKKAYYNKKKKHVSRVESTI